MTICPSIIPKPSAYAILCALRPMIALPHYLSLATLHKLRRQRSSLVMSRALYPWRNRGPVELRCGLLHNNPVTRHRHAPPKIQINACTPLFFRCTMRVPGADSSHGAYANGVLAQVCWRADATDAAPSQLKLTARLATTPYVRPDGLIGQRSRPCRSACPHGTLSHAGYVRLASRTRGSTCRPYPGWPTTASS